MINRKFNFIKNVMWKLPHYTPNAFTYNSGYRRKTKNGKYIAVPFRAPFKCGCNNRWSNLEANVLAPRRILE
jgi:hypothetical protein